MRGPTYPFDADEEHGKGELWLLFSNYLFTLLASGPSSPHARPRRPQARALVGHKHAPSSATRTRPCRPQERALVGHKNIVPQHALIVSKTHPSALTVYSAICMFKVDLCLSKLDRYQ